MYLRPNQERLLFNTLSFIVFCYAVLRAKLIPITIDEVSTVVYHAALKIPDIVSYKADAMPNNHVLHTLLVKLSTWLLGHHHVVVRIPAILGGMLYVWAATRISALAPAFWLRLFTWIVLLGNPYMVEFFSLARGYSLSAGAMLAAIYFAVLYLGSLQLKDIGYALFWGVLAVESNFTLLNFFAPFVVLLLIASRSPQKSKWALNWALIAFGVIILTILCYPPIAAMRASNQFVFWGNEGFFKETLVQLVRTFSRNSDFAGPDTHLIVAWTVISIAVTGWIIALVRWRRNGFRLDMPVLVSGIFAGTFIVNMLQHYLFATPFLNARTSLFYYPLFALQFAVVVQWIWEKWRYYALIIALPVTWLFVVNFYRCANFTNAYEWWFDAGTFKTINFMVDLQETEKRTEPYTFDTNWPNFNSFLYHTQKSTPHYESVIKMVEWHSGREFPRNTEFYYTDSDDDVNKLKDDYEVVMVIPETGLRLLRKR